MMFGTAIFATKVKKQITIITLERPMEKFALFCSCKRGSMSIYSALLLQEAKFRLKNKLLCYNDDFLPSS